VHTQEIEDTRKAEKDTSVSNPGQENKTLLEENPSSNMPPATDHGDIGPVWYSFDLAHKRVQEGGWTHEVNSKVLPTSKDLAGANMRITAGSFRELHWHTADEWAIMLFGYARVTVMNPDGTMFIDDVRKGDLWLFPAGYPHSIQGLDSDGCEFLPVFDEGSFSEDGTFLLSETVAHILRATGYNLIAIPVAAGIFIRWRLDLPMSVGAMAMSLSTIIVALNAQLLRRLKLGH
jgi:oxalate decarboxylase